MRISFFVPGEPKPQGSKDQFGRESCKALPAWRNMVSFIAKQEMKGAPPTKSHISLVVSFMFPRPKSHFGTGKNANVLKHDAPFDKASKPDIDKLSRAIMDAGTGIIWHDDSQVVSLEARKFYGERIGASIVVDFQEAK